MSLPTLVPGGGATGAFAGAIRVGKLENGKLIVGRVGPDGEELTDGDDSSDEDGEEEGEEGLEEAGREALMWGMVGGVVVQEEDLEKGGEELLKRVKGELGIQDETKVEVVPPPARMDFYQAEKSLTVSVYEKGLIPADVRVEFEERQVSLGFFPRRLFFTSSRMLRSLETDTEYIVVLVLSDHSPPPNQVHNHLPSLRFHQLHPLLVPSLERQNRASPHEVSTRPSMEQHHLESSFRANSYAPTHAFFATKTRRRDSILSSRPDHGSCFHRHLRRPHPRITVVRILIATSSTTSR